MSKELTRRGFLGSAGLAGAALGLAASAKAGEKQEGRVPTRQETRLEHRLRAEIDKIRMVDTHEHLYPPHMLAERKSLDATWLFADYAGSDLVSAGMPQSDMNEIRNMDSKLSAIERWEKIRPWYKKTWNTAFLEPLQIAVRDLFGVHDIADSTFVEITRKMESAPKDTWTRTVFDKAGIEIAMQNNTAGRPVLPKKRYPDIFLDDIVDWFTYADKGRVDQLVAETGIEIGSLNDHLRAVDWYFDKYADETTAYKIIRAYDRTLQVDNVPRADAEPLYNRFRKGEQLSPKELKAIEDFLIHYCVTKAGEHNLPVKVHTGIPINTGRAADFLSVITSHPNVMFDIFHISWPYAEEFVHIVKSEPNVWADFCWTWSMNPVSARRYLSEMLECVPCVKIHGFGGDVNYVEETYGQAMLAKREITRVLAEKVEQGRFTEDYALELARMILRENAMEHFKIAEKRDVCRGRGPERA